MNNRSMSAIAQLLKKELEKRQKNNPAYSLRAFANFLEMSPAALSQVMSGKRGISVKRLEKITETLGLSPKDQLKVMEVESSESRKTALIKEDEFALISEWYHFAILSLGELDENQADARWIASRLNITAAAANKALSRLLRMGIIEVQNGKFKQVGDPIKTTTDIPSSSIKNYHKGVLALGQNKLDTVPVNLREFSSITMAVNTRNLEKAKKLTQQYKQQMLKLMEKGKQDEIYQLSIQLFPLSVGDE